MNSFKEWAEALSRQPLRTNRLLLDEADYDEIKSAAICEHCGSWFDKRITGQHPGPGCDLQRVRDIIES